jgi:putative ubiquitin-RnfH superfamily antitoxin RatB of RatAB toxin-antitoxin module
MFAFVEYPATSKRTSLRRLNVEEVYSVVTTKSLVPVTFSSSASTKDLISESGLASGVYYASRKF